jgi:hypothetical protein
MLQCVNRFSSVCDQPIHFMFRGRWAWTGHPWKCSQGLAGAGRKGCYCAVCLAGLGVADPRWLCQRGRYVFGTLGRRGLVELVDCRQFLVRDVGEYVGQLLALEPLWVALMGAIGRSRRAGCRKGAWIRS